MTTLQHFHTFIQHKTQQDTCRRGDTPALPTVVGFGCCPRDFRQLLTHVRVRIAAKHG